MKSEYVPELFLVCDECGHQELPDFTFAMKMSYGEVETKDIPMHCSETMRPTIQEINEEERNNIDTVGTGWMVKETVKMHFKNKANVSLGEDFAREYDRLLENAETEPDILRLQRLRKNIEPVLKTIIGPGEEFDVININCNMMIDNVLEAAKARIGVKRKQHGPVMPGSDPSFDIKYYCTVCKEYLEIPDKEKSELLESSSDVKLPLHHDKEVVIRIIESEKPQTIQGKQSDSNYNFEILNNAEQMTVLSVGIDIGSSTSHLIFSRLTLHREPGFLNMSNRFNVVKREILYEGDIIITPLIDSTSIDIDAVVAFCEEEYSKAGITPEMVDTGAVIITGETAKKHNAAEIVERLSEETGKFVSATAGPNFESLLAAMGSGAVALSREKQNTILSVDIGGGTSNLAISSKGEVLSTSCINVGGRLLGMDKDFRIWRMDAPTIVVMQELNLNYKIGDIITEEDILHISKSYTEALIEVMTGPATSPVAKALMMTDDLDFSVPIDEILFCGGVSEFIYNNSAISNEFNDIGRYIAGEMKAHDFGITVIEPKNKIRATVIGAGSYSLSVSGSTCYFDDNIKLPIENIPVLYVNARKEKFSNEHIKTEIARAFNKFDMAEGEDMVALYFKDPIYWSDRYLPEFAQAIEQALPNSVAEKKMIILLFAGNMGSMVGINILKETSIQENLICLDELMLEEGDWVDIGDALYSGHTFPVTVKSLAFNQN